MLTLLKRIEVNQQFSFMFQYWVDLVRKIAYYHRNKINIMLKKLHKEFGNEWTWGEDEKLHTIWCLETFHSMISNPTRQ